MNINNLNGTKKGTVKKIKEKKSRNEEEENANDEYYNLLMDGMDGTSMP